jgi:hypothetical protein
VSYTAAGVRLPIIRFPKTTRGSAMLHRSVFLRAGLAVAVLSIGLAGCDSMRPSRTTEIYEATLSGAQEVPPRATAGSGSAEVTYNQATSTLHWKVTYSGLTGPITGAHIHGPAGPGQNAGVLIPFSGALNVSPIQGEIRISAEQLGQLASGQWYVNLHTAANPGGEIRGQLRPRRG